MSDTVETLGEALPKEQARVRELILMYRDPMLRGAGGFAAALMDQSLRNADKAVMSGDLLQMIAAYNELKGWHE